MLFLVTTNGANGSGGAGGGGGNAGTPGDGGAGGAGGFGTPMVVAAVTVGIPEPRVAAVPAVQRAPGAVVAAPAPPGLLGYRWPARRVTAGTVGPASRPVSSVRLAAVAAARRRWANW